MIRRLTPTMEMYLETIKKIGEKKKAVRVKGIAQELKIKMPSVSEALKSLSQKGLIKHERYGYIELTDKGNKLAEKIDFRHRVLFSFLLKFWG